MSFTKGVALLGFNTPPLGALPAGGVGDVFPHIREDFKEKSSIPQGLPCGCSLCGSVMAFLQAEEKPDEKKAYIVGTFLTGLGEHLNGDSLRGLGTAIEWINGGTVYWSNIDENDKDITPSWPLIFDVKLLSRFGFGLTFGDLLTISMNDNYQDANHIYFGFSYVHSIKKWDLGASLIVFPVYITDDELIAGKIDVTHWFINSIGVTMSAVFGGTTGWSTVRVWHLSASAGISLKIGG